ncbi:MAG: hypothetical protein NC236_01530 [Mycoplasma sp.]|nr:hypothetical protein [Mycoplasma sp.]
MQKNKNKKELDTKKIIVFTIIFLLIISAIISLLSATLKTNGGNTKSAIRSYSKLSNFSSIVKTYYGMAGIGGILTFSFSIIILFLTIGLWLLSKIDGKIIMFLSIGVAIMLILSIITIIFWSKINDPDWLLKHLINPFN